MKRLLFMLMGIFFALSLWGQKIVIVEFFDIETMQPLLVEGEPKTVRCGIFPADGPPSEIRDYYLFQHDPLLRIDLDYECPPGSAKLVIEKFPDGYTSFSPEAREFLFFIEPDRESFIRVECKKDTILETKYHELEKQALRDFLSSPSAVAGKLNWEFTRLTISDVENWYNDENWLDKIAMEQDFPANPYGLSIRWSNTTPKQAESMLFQNLEYPQYPQIYSENINLAPFTQLRILALMKFAENKISIANMPSLTFANISNGILSELSIINCPNFTQGEFYENNISMFEMYNLPKLNTIYAVNNHKIKDFKMSNCGSMGGLRVDVYENKLETLTIIDSKLHHLNCHGNLLKRLDITNCPNLYELPCYNNYLKFSSLPIDSRLNEWWYQYAPQKSIPIKLTSYNSVDLSSEYMINGIASTYTWKNKSGQTLAEGTDYSISNGITTFLKEQTDSVYCILNNASFSKLSGSNALKTSSISTIKGTLDTIYHELEKQALRDFLSSPSAVAGKFNWEFTRLTASDVKNWHNDENWLDKISMEQDFPANPYGLSIRWSKTIPKQAESMLFQNLEYPQYPQIYSGNINLAPFTQLRILALMKFVENKISIANMPSLVFANISNGILNELSIINCPNFTQGEFYENNVSLFEMSNLPKLNTVYAINNHKIKDFKMSNCGSMGGLRVDVYENQLETLTIIDSKLHHLNCQGNLLKSLDITNCPNLYELPCYDNYLRFSTLPIDARLNEWWYQYAPQKSIPIELTSNNSVDLSSEYMINGIASTYTWKNKSGQTLVEGTDYSISNGVTKFLKEQTDSIYCELNNTNFPKLSGSNALKTTYVKIFANIIHAVADIEVSKTTEIKVYPTPVKNVLNIESSETIELAQFFNASGKLVKNENNVNGTIDVSSLAKGVYILKLTTDKETKTIKVIKE